MNTCVIPEITQVGKLRPEEGQRGYRVEPDTTWQRGIRRFLSTIPKPRLKAQWHTELAAVLPEQSVLLSIQDNRGDTAILLARIATYITQIQLFPQEM